MCMLTVIHSCLILSTSKLMRLEPHLLSCEDLLQAYMVRLGMAGFSNMDEMIKDLKKCVEILARLR